MDKTWLILDCHYLCHRAFYAFGGLAHEGFSTGIAYGFLKDIESLRKTFSTNHLIFCWDVGKPLRKKEDPNYKANRKASKKDMSEAEIQSIIDFREQVKIIRKVYLKEIGYKNNFYQKGYEADDIIAVLCKEVIPQRDTAIIISADQDLYQLLNKRISIYHPQKKKVVTEESFAKEYGIKPFWWPRVKALAGCSTDNIKGVMGVGEKTAIKYLRGELKKESNIYPKIIAEEKNGLIDRNLKLVRLPFIGVNSFRLRKDKLSRSGWNNVLKSLGIKSIKGDFNGQVREGFQL
jgi:DNA polymerase-1